MDYSDRQKVMDLWETFESVSRYYKSATNEDQVVELMEVTKGTLNGKPFYRPYLVAAIFLEIQIDVNQITKADGVEFTNLRQPATTYRGLQRQIDGAFPGVKVPESFVIPECDPCEAAASGGSTASKGRNYGLFTGTLSVKKSR